MRTNRAEIWEQIERIRLNRHPRPWPNRIPGTLYKIRGQIIRKAEFWGWQGKAHSDHWLNWCRKQCWNQLITACLPKNAYGSSQKASRSRSKLAFPAQSTVFGWSCLCRASQRPIRWERLSTTPSAVAILVCAWTHRRRFSGEVIFQDVLRRLEPLRNIIQEQMCLLVFRTGEPSGIS